MLKKIINKYLHLLNIAEAHIKNTNVIKKMNSGTN